MNRIAVLVVPVAAAALLVGVAIGALFLPMKATIPTKTSSSSSLLHEVIFNDTGNCPPPPLTYPEWWAVTLNNKTVVEPPSAGFPLPEGGIEMSSSFKNYSVIVFSVPSGSYNYTVYPQVAFLYQRGTLVVGQSDVVVQVQVNLEIGGGCMAH